MKCPKCGSVNLSELPPKDSQKRFICNDCDCIMMSQEPKTVSVSNEDVSITNATPALNKESTVENISSMESVSNLVSDLNKASTDKKSFLKTFKTLAKKNPMLQELKVWIKNPVSMISAVMNGVLLVVSIVLLVLFCNSGPSVDDEIKNYAVANGYELADFDKFNSPAEENGLGNTKVYFHGKVKELTKVDSINVALVEDTDNSKNVWAVVPFDNYIYSQFQKGKKVAIFGYYSGYSNELNMPVVYYTNGYMKNEWYEYEDTFGIFESLKNDSSSVTDSNFVDSSTENSTTTEETNEEISKGNLGDYTVEIVSAHVSKDYKKRECVIIEYKFTNNSDEATNFRTKMIYKAFQDGIELDNVYSYDDSYDNDAYQREIKPGKTITVYTAFLLNDKTNPVEIEVKEFLSRSGEKVVKTFELTK